MSYNNYGPPPGAWPPRQQGGAPNMGPPPSMGAAPGMDAFSPPAVSGFQAPPMPPNFNFNAPVIRLGVDAPKQQNSLGGRGSNAEPLGRRDRPGLGADGPPRNLDRERAAVRESMMALQPPTREEVARTIFIGGIGEGAPGDDSIDRLLRSAGKLRRWTRVKDAKDKKCKFGFAEFEDVESLEAASEIFYPGIEVPILDNKGAVVKDEDGEVKMMTLLVVVDEQSRAYIEEWKGKRREDDDARQFRIDGCREDLTQSLASLVNAGAYLANGEDRDGDVPMGEANGEASGEGAEVVTISLALDDELSDIPPEMRATVAEEIKAFRDRSNRRDIERLRKEEEQEQTRGGGRINRLAASPPPSAPSGPASASNGIPVGPRGAPLGPRGYRGVQLPNDYVNGVNFVGANGAAPSFSRREDEDASESDEELERRRVEKQDAEMEKLYLDSERRLLNRERTRAAAQEREKVREEAENRDREREKEAIAKRLRDWDDDEEARLAREEYYYDRSSWLRKRGAHREREARDDERDRAIEAREEADSNRKSADARGLADAFLDQTGAELMQRAQERESQPRADTGVKISLNRRGAQPPAPPVRSSAAEVEGLLEDEEDAAASGIKRTELRPLETSSRDLTQEEQLEARKEVAASIPTSTEELFAYPVKFSLLTDKVMSEHIHPFVVKKVVEFLGVQEDLLVETVVQGLREMQKGEKKEGGAREIVKELEDALDEEAEALVRKVWRMVAFWTECEARGIGGE